MLGLATHELRFTILRDVVPIGRQRFAQVCGEYFEPACRSKGIAFSVSDAGADSWILGEVDALEKMLEIFLK